MPQQVTVWKPKQKWSMQFTNEEVPDKLFQANESGFRTTSEAGGVRKKRDQNLGIPLCTPPDV